MTEPTSPISPAKALSELGGVASRAAILKRVPRRAFDRAVADGDVVRLSWGRYALPSDDAARQAAQALTGTAILITAAAHWGWERKREPKWPQIAVPPGRVVKPHRRERVDVRWRAVDPADVVDGWVTSRVRTLLDCAVLLPFEEALSIADSALRDGTVTRTAMLRRAASLPVQQRRRVSEVFRLADHRAHGPFESVLRAIALDIPGLELEPQVRIDDKAGWVGRVDLADRRLRIVLEADSMEYHGEREVMDRDCARYSRLVADGWLVLRFTWEQVMHKPDWVRGVIEDTVALRGGGCTGCGHVPAEYTLTR